MNILIAILSLIVFAALILHTALSIRALERRVRRLEKRQGAARERGEQRAKEEEQRRAEEQARAFTEGVASILSYDCKKMTQRGE